MYTNTSTNTSIDMNISDKSVNSLLSIIQNEQCFRDYAESKKTVEADSNIRQKLTQYRLLNHELQLKKLNGKPVAFDEERLISNIYQMLILHPDAKRFLEAEKELSLLLNEIFRKTTDTIGIDVNFFI